MNNLRQAAQQALKEMDDHMYRADTHEFYEAKEALRAALAEPERAPVESISAEQISKMFHRLEGIDQNQWGYHWKKGWNDALREAMDYCQAAPTPRKPLTKEERVNLVEFCGLLKYSAGYYEAICVTHSVEAAHGIGEQHE